MGSSDAIGGGPAARPGWVGGAGLVLLCLVVYLPGFFSIPPVDRDESRFAQASRQMLEGGDWTVPRVQDRARLNKPPLIYWLQAGSVWVLTGGDSARDAIWMYRVPSLLAAIAAVLVTWRLGSSMFDPRTGRMGAALLACCPVIAWEARQARADMVLLALTTLAVLALWHTRRHSALGRTHIGWVLCFWLALSAAVMTKGPVAPMIALLTILGVAIWARDWRWIARLHPWFGIPLVGLLVLPWVWAVASRPEIGWDLYWKTVWDETIGRSAAPKEGHWGPPGYHTVLMPVLFWPGSLLTGLGIVMAWRAARARGAGGASGEADLFCLAWIIPGWLVFEFIGTKLPHYTMPMYPALALLSARAVFAAEAGLVPQVRTRVVRLGMWAWLGIGGAVAAGVVPLVSAAVGYSDSLTLGIAVIAVAVLGLAVMARNLLTAWVGVRRGRFVRAQLAGIACVTFAWIVVQVGAPPVLGLSTRVMRAVDAADPSGTRPLGLVGYHEDSMVFLSRGRAERIETGKLGEWITGHPGALVVVPKDEVTRNMVPRGEARGLNYSRGRIEQLAVVETFAPPEPAP